MKNNDEIRQFLFDYLDQLDHIKPEDIPNIDLYMDQVTTFMDAHLSNTKRYPDDKVLTKTMINNYAKNNLLPPPVRKKYSKDHMLLLIFIYYFKNLLSITDIQTLLNPISEKCFGENAPLKLESIYREVFTREKALMKELKEDVSEKFENARHTFTDTPAEDREMLQRFAFLCHLSFDVYLKTALIESVIDEIKTGEPDKQQQKKPSKKEE